MTDRELVTIAEQAMMRAYAPYSEFQVGAALLTEDGTVFEGANIENAAHTPTCCAERMAFFQAVYQGHRAFSAIAVVGGHRGKLTGLFPPCGVCRQVMMEFCTPDFLVHMGHPGGITTVRLSELLPFGFNSKDHLS